MGCVIYDCWGKISINPIFQEHPSEMLWPATADTSCKVGFATEQTEKGLLVWQRSVSLSIYIYTSSTAQGGGGSFKNRKPIGEVGCCESGMAERSHWWTERCLRSPLFLSLFLSVSLSFSDYLPTYLLICLSTYLSVCLSISLSIYLPIYLAV